MWALSAKFSRCGRHERQVKNYVRCELTTKFVIILLFISSVTRLISFASLHNQLQSWNNQLYFWKIWFAENTTNTKNVSEIKYKIHVSKCISNTEYISVFKIRIRYNCMSPAMDACLSQNTKTYEAQDASYFGCQTFRTLTVLPFSYPASLKRVWKKPNSTGTSSS